MFDLLVDESQGQRIRRLRELRGWSLATLSQNAGMKGTSGLWLIEQDKSKSPYHLAAIAKALETTVEYLRTGSEADGQTEATGKPTAADVKQMLPGLKFKDIEEVVREGQRILASGGHREDDEKKNRKGK